MLPGCAVKSSGSVTAAVRQDQAERLAGKMSPGSISKAHPWGPVSPWSLVPGPLLCLGLSPGTGTSHSVPFTALYPAKFICVLRTEISVWMQLEPRWSLAYLDSLDCCSFKAQQGFAAFSLALLLNLDYIYIFFHETLAWESL